jgi:hypothetical protein
MLRRISLVLLAVALIVGITATGGLSINLADRDVTVAVVDDDSAYVGYNSPPTLNVTSGDRVTLVTVTNRFDTAIDVTDVTVDSPTNVTASVEPYPEGIGPGESGAVTASISCSSNVTTESLQVTITVEGSDVSATVFGRSETRTITTDCQA